MEPILTKYVREPNGNTLDFYVKHEGYQGLRKALSTPPNDVIEIVKASGLRGRGGAGFPTGLKWQFVLKDTPLPKYICCNADESEPGTFKDHVLMERNPHLLFEGCLIGCWAIGAKVAYIYIRGEFYHVQRVLERELEKAYAQGYVGKNILGTGFDCDIVIHRGAGAYEAGEETALIESLEGKRAQPRIKPPFPAVSGLYNCPTAVNNVETLCALPSILTNGAEWFASLGPEKNGGPKLYCISGHVKKPGVYELPLGATLEELVQVAGGYEGNPMAFSPGGASSGFLPIEKRNLPLDFKGLAKDGSMLGSAGVVVLNDTVDMAKAAQWQLEFFEDESCGQCAPCRIGTRYLHNQVGKYLKSGDPGALKHANDVGWEMEEGSICGLGMVAHKPLVDAMKHFPKAFEKR